MGGGVEAFLVIGSYFLTNKYLKREQNEIAVGEAFLHRIKRLYPAFLSLVLVSSLGLIVYKRSITFEPLWYVFSLQNFRVLFENSTYSLDSFIGHFWYIGMAVSALGGHYSISAKEAPSHGLYSFCPCWNSMANNLHFDWKIWGFVYDTCRTIGLLGIGWIDSIGC